MPDDTSPLVSARQLASRLGARDTLVVDCRFDLADPQAGRRAWREGHVPGAPYAHLDEDLSSPVTPATGRHPLPDPQAFARTLHRWALDEETRVVAYDQGGGMFAARLWWLLRARGHRRVQVLDGGWAAWTAAGLPVSREEDPPRPPSPAVASRPFEGWLTTGEVERGLASGALRLVDARAADRFAGRNEKIDPVAGHVPGAVNHPFDRNLGPDGRFLDAGELRRRWEETLAGHPPAGAAMMCGSGVTACHNLLALDIAGLPGARLYAGSWSEWIRSPNRAVAT